VYIYKQEKKRKKRLNEKTQKKVFFSFSSYTIFYIVEKEKRKFGFFSFFF
jgi:hypothetical protein